MKKVLENLKFVVGIVTLLLVFVFKNDLSIVALVGGVGVALYGICSFLTGEKIGFVLTGLGISLVSATSIYKLNILPEFESVTFFICLSMALIVILSFIFEYFNDKDLRKVHSLEVEAEVVDLLKNPNTTKEYYQPIYEYSLNEEILTVGLPGFINKGIPNLGDKLKIYVNPNDILDVYFEKRKSDKLYMIAVGLFFLIASIVIIITLFV